MIAQYQKSRAERDSGRAVSFRLWRRWCLALAPLLPLATPLSDGPPLAHTGGFGEPTCLACHAGSPLNQPGGELVLAGPPEHFIPGQSYPLEVVLRRAGTRRAGFEVSIRHANGEQAGTLESAEPGRIRVQRDSVRGVWYAHHTREGSNVTGDTVRWHLRWTAPMAHEDVVVNGVSVSANDDNSPLDDAVYAMTAVLRPR